MTMLDGYDLSDDGTELALFAENHGPLYAEYRETIRRIAGREGGYDETYAREQWATWLTKALVAYRRCQRSPAFYAAREPADLLLIEADFAETVEWWERAERALIENGEHAWLTAA